MLFFENSARLLTFTFFHFPSLLTYLQTTLYRTSALTLSTNLEGL